MVTFVRLPAGDELVEASPLAGQVIMTAAEAGTISLALQQIGLTNIIAPSDFGIPSAIIDACRPIAIRDLRIYNNTIRSTVEQLLMNESIGLE